MMLIFLFLLINSISLDSCNGFCWTTNCEIATPAPTSRSSIIEDLTDITKQLIQRLKLSDSPTVGPSIDQTTLDVWTDVPSPNVSIDAVTSENASSLSPSLSDTPSVELIMNVTQFQIETYAPSPSVLKSAVPTVITSSSSPSSGIPMQLSNTPSIAPTANASLLQIETDVSDTNVHNSTASQASTVSPSTTDIVYGWLMTIFPKISAFLSIIGSGMVIASVAKSRKNRGNIQQRIVGAMSCVDFIAAVTWFLTPLFIPTYFKDRGIPLALGNETTCDVQGFIIQLCSASFLYSASLSVYYVLIIKYQWKTDRVKKLEKYLHICPLGWSLITAIVSLSVGIIGDATWDCWIEPQYPAYQWAFFFGPLMISLGINILNMAQVYYYVKNIEDKAAKYKRTSVKEITHKNTLEIAKQNKFYVLSFIITWVLIIIARILQIGGSIQLPPWFTVICVFMVYFQGFFHAIVYYRPRFQKIAKDYPDKHWAWITYQIMLKIFGSKGDDCGDILVRTNTTTAKTGAEIPFS